MRLGHRGAATITDDPIPKELAEGFNDAVGRFRFSWSPALHGPEVSIDQIPYTIDAVCRLVMSFNDRLPDALADELLDISTGYEENDLRTQLANERSYAAGAQCLLRVMELTTREYQMREDVGRKS